jgi:hypothetical protein
VFLLGVPIHFSFTYKAFRGINNSIIPLSNQLRTHPVRLNISDYTLIQNRLGTLWASTLELKIPHNKKKCRYGHLLNLNLCGEWGEGIWNFYFAYCPAHSELSGSMLSSQNALVSFYTKP